MTRICLHCDEYEPCGCDIAFYVPDYRDDLKEIWHKLNNPDKTPWIQAATGEELVDQLYGPKEE